MADTRAPFLYTSTCRSVLIKEIVQERMPMVSQLMDGLKTCGVLEAIQTYLEELRSLFLIGRKDKLDEDTFLDLFHVEFSL